MLTSIIGLVLIISYVVLEKTWFANQTK